VIEMVLATSFETVRESVEPHPSGAMVTDLIGRRGVTGGGPTSYLVEVPDGYVIKPHFHGVDQYQVVVRGTAQFGKHPMTPGDFHYADAHTPYGPIVAGEGGMAFFTLRPSGYDGFHEMPESRRLRQPSQNRTFVRRVDPAAARTSGAVELETLGDGTAAYQVTAGPRERLPLPALDHGGAFVLVIGGVLTLAGEQLLRDLSCVWVAAHEPLPVLTATDSGAVALFLSYPRISTDGVNQ
jgi:mannose-6-phosphate isomerase-like protein (cupin superfamily)